VFEKRTFVHKENRSIAPWAGCPTPCDACGDDESNEGDRRGWRRERSSRRERKRKQREKKGERRKGRKRKGEEERRRGERKRRRRGGRQRKRK
jgi:hypothetical protein